MMGAANKDDLDVVVTGITYHLIKPGIYEAKFTHHETTPQFDGKLYLWFDLYSLDENEKTISLFKPYNLREAVKSKRRGGKIIVGKKSNFVKDCKRLFGHVNVNRLSTSLFKGKVFEVKVVVSESIEPYSFIQEIIKVNAGK